LNSEHAQRVYFEQINRAVPLEAILQHYDILAELKRVGTQLKGCCPVHKGSNSQQFVVDLNKNVWRCFSPQCDRGGSIFELVSELEHVEIVQAAQLIAGWFAIGTSNHTFNHRNQQRRRSMSGERPSHKCFVVEDRGEGDDKDAFWTRIGSAWPHKDGKGLNLQLAALPANGGRIVLREFTEDDAKEEEQQKGKRKK